MFVLYQIMNADSEAQLQDSVAKAQAVISMAGCCRAINLRNCKQVAEELAKWYVVQRTRAAYDSFAEGLKALGVLSALREHPKQMTALFIKKDLPLTAEFMEELFKITLSEPGSNRYNVECRTVEDILVFTTGTNYVPALGFNPEPSIYFLEDNQDCTLPLASTCENIIRLPTFPKTYESFCEKMGFGIRNSPGFGFA
uniref:HECT domain-containing protein n=1 Tax=Cyprinus carpio TaxID=7962 RepID=A0A8C2PV97_CYPCA